MSIRVHGGRGEGVIDLGLGLYETVTVGWGAPVDDDSVKRRVDDEGGARLEYGYHRLGLKSLRGYDGLLVAHVDIDSVLGHLDNDD